MISYTGHMMNISDMSVGQEVFVRFSDPMHLRGIVTRLVIHNGIHYAIVWIDGREQRCRLNWITQDAGHITDEQFEQWWQAGGGDTETCFHWYASNYHLVDLDGVVNSEHLALAIKQARYEHTTGRKWSGFTGDKTK